MKAYELIDSPEKWVNHFPSAGTHCAATAICQAYEYFDDTYKEAVKRLTQHLLDQGVTDCIGEWNDAQDWETVYNTLKSLDI